MNKKLYNCLLPVVILLLGSLKVSSQTIPCPPNLDFEFGDFTLWECQSGGAGYPGGALIGPGAPPPPQVPQTTCVTPTNIGPIAGRHTVTSGSGIDGYGSFPVVCPGGGAHSLKLGDNQINAGADRVRFLLRVPVGVNNYSFSFKYAVVLEDPGHSPQEQPRFTISAIDSATGIPIKNGCYDQNFIAAAGLPGFFTSPVGFNVRVKPWTNGILNISGTAGQTVIIDIVAGDCSATGHFGYGYFDVIDCGQFKAAVASCDLDGQGIVLTGPPGYQTYQWYNQDYSTLIDTGQVAIDTPSFTIPQSYNLVLTPYPTVSLCKDTIVTFPIANVDVQATPDTSCMTPGQPIQLDANTFGGVAPLTYLWTEYNTSGNTLSCYDCPQPTATPTGTSFYTIKVTDSNGCYRTDTLRVYYSTFVPDAGSSFITCVGTPVTFNASVTPQSSVFTYDWSPSSPGLSSNTVLNPTFTPTATGTTIFTLSIDSLACSKTDTMSVTVLPNDIFIADTTICDGMGSFKVVALGDPAFTYSWSPTLGVSDPTIIDPIITTDTSRTYIVTASYPTCPTIVKTFNIEVQPTPDVTLGADTSKCQWQDLFVVSDVTPTWYTNYTYQWTSKHPGVLNSTTTPNVFFYGQASDTLKLVVKSPIGCSDSDDIGIVVHQGNFAAITPAETEICPNTPVPINITGGATYTWDPPLFIDDTTSGNVVSNPSSSINYTVYVLDTAGCSDTLTTSIVVHSDAVLDLGSDLTIYPGDTVQMSPTGNCMYFQWFPPMGLSHTNISNPYASPVVNTRYFLTGTTEHGCVATDSINIFVDTETALAVPNAFTPGASGSNNILKVIRRGKAELKSFRIYDRWGMMVFESKDINQGWDGKYKGLPQPMGIYVYIVEAIGSSAEAGGRRFYKQGNVTLIR